MIHTKNKVLEIVDIEIWDFMEEWIAVAVVGLMEKFEVFGFNGCFGLNTG